MKTLPSFILAGACGIAGVGMLLACASAAEAPQTPAAATPRISAGQAVILGVVEGLTEYLPVSSTGHLILASHAMGLSEYDQPAGALGRKIAKVPSLDAFEIVIQLGAVLAVLGLYRRRVGQMCRGLVGKDPAGRGLLVALAVAFVPAGVTGYLFHKPIEEHLFTPLAVAAALAVGGVLMIVVEHLCKRRRTDAPRTTPVDQVRLWQALVIGAAQCLAMWPGTSRSMITILAALIVGLDMAAAAEFSFLLALPTLGAATAYAGYKDWHILVQSAGADGMILGLVVTAVVAALAVKGFVKWLTRHGLWPFGIYRIALAAAVIAYFAWK